MNFWKKVKSKKSTGPVVWQVYGDIGMKSYLIEKTKTGELAVFANSDLACQAIREKLLNIPPKLEEELTSYTINTIIQ